MDEHHVLYSEMVGKAYVARAKRSTIPRYHVSVKLSGPDDLPVVLEIEFL